jgi:hypothetical protein
LISSQSFLVLAYGTAMSGLIGHWGEPLALAFPPFLALLGLTLFLEAWPGINAAYAVLDDWQQRQGELLTGNRDLTELLPPPLARTGDETDQTAQRRFQQGTLFAKQAPWIFAVAWCYFGALPIVFYLRG